MLTNQLMISPDLTNSSHKIVENCPIIQTIIIIQIRCVSFYANSFFFYIKLSSDSKIFIFIRFCHLRYTHRHQFMASLRLTNSPMTEFPATRLRRMPSHGSSRHRVGFRVFAAADAAEPDLGVTVNGLKMPNPFVIGSGPPGTNYTVMKRAFDEGWGAVIAKTVAA